MVVRVKVKIRVRVRVKVRSRLRVRVRVEDRVKVGIGDVCAVGQWCRHQLGNSNPASNSNSDLNPKSNPLQPPLQPPLDPVLVEFDEPTSTRCDSHGNFSKQEPLAYVQFACDRNALVAYSRL